MMWMSLWRKIKGKMSNERKNCLCILVILVNISQDNKTDIGLANIIQCLK